MSDDLVSRLKSCAKDCTMLGDEVDAAFFNEAAQALTEARAEIERRDAFIKELSDALRSIRPLGGSELFVKRFGNYYADPVYCKAAIEQDTEHKHNAMKAYVKERRRADAAESELATLRARVREVVGPFAKAGELFGPRLSDEYDQCIYSPAAGDEYSLCGDHLRAAHQLVEEVK